jgi:hypothetical protein
MSDLDRIKKLAGLTVEMDSARGLLEEYAVTDEAYSPGDENEEGMVSNCCGAPIMDVYEGHGRCSDCKEMAKAVAEESVEEAIGDSAECFYDLQDEYCGEECPSTPHKLLIDELVRYLSGDQLQDFCDDFKRHHMDG